MSPLKPDDSEEKPFSYNELFAMCYLCAAQGLAVALQKEFTSPTEGRLQLEEKIKDVINCRWDKK